MDHLTYGCKTCGTEMKMYSRHGYFGDLEPRKTWCECPDCGMKYNLPSELPKLFISMPMKGKLLKDIRKEYAKAIFDAEQKLGYITMPIYQLGKRPTTPAEALGESIADMGNADIVYFAEGWDLSRGCKIEHLVCEEYGIPYIEYETVEDSMKAESGLISE